MRFFTIALAALALAGCAAGGQSEEGGAPSPFPVTRGAAPPPPAQGVARQPAPPEGIAPGGLDFGRWRSADVATYATTFQSQIARRYEDRSEAQIRADLVANGFACEDGARLDCRIEAMERQCAYDWYVVLERTRAAPIAGFDAMCLGAR